MNNLRRATGYTGASSCQGIRSAMALDSVIPVLVPDPGHRFDGPFTVATDPARLLPALVAEEDLEHEGIVYRCGMQPGLADFPEWDVRGYVWPYMRHAQSDGDASLLWFMLRWFSGSFEKIDLMDKLLREHQAATWRLVRDEWDEGSQLIHIERACNGIYARIPWCSDPAGAEVLRANRDLHARLFALAGYLDPDRVEVLIGTAPCPGPLTWDHPSDS